MFLQTQLKSYLKPLRDWALLPAHVPERNARASIERGAPSFNTPGKHGAETEAAEHYLIPIGKADTVIDFTHTSIMTAGIKDCLRKLGETSEQVLSLCQGADRLCSVSWCMNWCKNGFVFVGSKEAPDCMFSASPQACPS